MAKHPRPSNETKEIRVYECVYEYGKAPPITYSYTYSYTRISSFLQRLDWTDPLFAGTYVAKRISLGTPWIDDVHTCAQPTDIVSSSHK